MGEQIYRAPSLYIAHIDRDACSGCGLCLDICKTQALKMEDDLVGLKPERCIGCGLCVGECTMEAIRLVAREEGPDIQYPADFVELNFRQHHNQ